MDFLDALDVIPPCVIGGGWMMFDGDVEKKAKILCRVKRTPPPEPKERKREREKM
jgi:hypothetical protein